MMDKVNSGAVMELEYQSYLVGSGHFAFGFILGYIWMLYLVQIKPDSLRTRLYSPYLPIVLGIWAALTYFFYQDATHLPYWLNIFVIYPLIHHDELFIILLGRPNWVVLICGILYTSVLWRYIRLAKHVRKYGWSGEKNA